MAKIVIEEVNRLGHVISRQKFDHLPIKVGRGYHNDLILSDPYVSPNHIIIDEMDDGWLVSDQNSENGIKLKLHSNQSAAGHLRSGDEVILGRTRLRLLSPRHPIHETHLLPTRASLPKIISHPAIAASTIILTLVILLFDAQLSSTKHTGFEKLLANSLPTFIFSLVWAGIWTFVGRVITHRASFLPHFIAALMIFLISMLTSTFSEYLTFNINSELAGTILEFAVIGLSLAGLLYINLANSTNLPRPSILKVSHSIAWSMITVGLFMQYVNQPEFTANPEYPNDLKAPFAKVAPGKSAEEFLKASEELFNDVKQDEET